MVGVRIFPIMDKHLSWLTTIHNMKQHETLISAHSLNSAGHHNTRDYEILPSSWMLGQIIWIMTALLFSVSLYIASHITESEISEAATGASFYHYKTAIQEMRTVELEDSSRIDLNSDTQIQVAISSEKRLVSFSKGEAYFDVAPDSSRPFLVETEHGVISVVGTEFNVNKVDGVVEIEVYEGVVRVALKQEITPILLRAGEGVRLGANRGIESIRITQAQPAWKYGWLDIHNQSLSYVVEQLNRYSNKKILLEPKIQQDKISGRFNIHDIQRTLEELSDVYELELHEYIDSNFLSRKLKNKQVDEVKNEKDLFPGMAA